MRVILLSGLLLAFCHAAIAAADPALTGAERKVVSAADFAGADSPTAGIQQAVDALPESGGTVTIPPGEYLLRQAIHLRSNVTLQGAGSNTVLRKKKHAESRLAAVAQRGSRSVRVVNASGFSAGDQVAIRDKDAMGWNVVQAIITGVQGSELLLDRPMPRACDAAKTGFVIHAFPAITADRASKIVIKDLAIKDDAVRDLGVYGPLDNPRAKWALVLPFHLAAIHLNFVADSRVEGCSVAGWLSDGISVQGGAVKGPSAGNNTVAGCVVEKCGGIGLHPGGGLHDSVFSHNISRGNGGDGLYFCAGVQRVTVSENQFIGNRGNGIGGLGDFGDKYNTVANNVCAENGTHGVLMCEGDNNTVTGNTCRNNSQSAPGQYSGIGLRNTSLSVVKGNRCFDDQPTKTQKHGIEELPNCRGNTITGNDCRGNAQADVVLAADQAQPGERKDSPQRPGPSSADPPLADPPQAAPARAAARGRGPEQPPKELTVDLGGGVKMEFVLIPAGEFMMGDEKGLDNEKPVHKVTITKPFYLGKYEVTQEQWEAVMGHDSSHFKGAKNPADQVSWNNCQDFVARLNEKLRAGGVKFSLPTEAQWEYACRGGTTTRFSFGDDPAALGEYAWWAGNSEGTTHPVGQKKPNAWGLYDMHGNVWEWCADRWAEDYYRTSPADDPVGPDSGDERVARGACWRRGLSPWGNVDSFRCARRDSHRPPEYRFHPLVGFRVARTADQIQPAERKDSAQGPRGTSPDPPPADQPQASPERDAAQQPRAGPAQGAARGRAPDAAPATDQPQAAAPQASPGGRGGRAAPPAAPMKVGPPQVIDYTDPTYGAKVRQLRKDDGHEHNFYYYREVWNADGSRSPRRPVRPCPEELARLPVRRRRRLPQGTVPH